MANALKIEIQTSWSGATPVYGETIYFDEDEYRGCVITNNARCEILESLKHKPDVYDGTKYNASLPASQAQGRIISIDIYHMYSSTKTTLDTLLSYKNLLKVYYKYITDPTAYILCFLDPVDKEYYLSGEQQAGVISKLSFYETQDYGSSGITSLYLTNGISIIPEVIIDPDGMNIKLDGTKDLISVSNIIQKIDIEPGRAGIIENNDVSITINNINNYCKLFNNSDATTSFNPFRNIFGVLFASSSAGESYIYSGIGKTNIGYTLFKQGDLCSITDGINTETKVVSSVAIVPGATAFDDDKQRVTFTENLLYDYAVNSAIQSWSFIGKTVLVNIRFEKEYYKYTKSISTITVFKGKIRETPKVNGNTASLTVESWINEILSTPILIKNSALNESAINRCGSDGTFTSSILWSTQTGSGTLSGVTIYTDSLPGFWEITFSNATNFTVTGPNCNTKAGTTASDFYDQTDATDSQIKIASASWGGTPSSGDVLQFYTSLNYNGKNISEIVYDLLINQVSLTTDDIDTNTINTTIVDSQIHYISFSEPQTIGDVISIICGSGRYFLTQTYDGKFKISKFEQFGYEIISSAYTALDSANIRPSITLKDYKLNVSDIYNEIIYYYGYNYVDSTYQYVLKYPASDSTNTSYKLNTRKRTAIFYAPSIYPDISDTSGTVSAALYSLYSYGNIIFNGELSICAAQYVEPGYLFKYTASQALGIYVTEKELDINNCSISIRGINLKQYPTA